MPALGLVGQAEAAPEALYIGHAERKRAYEWQAIRVEEIVLGRSRACFVVEDVACLAGKACGFSVCGAATSMC
jgi:hypothetical protein